MNNRTKLTLPAILVMVVAGLSGCLQTDGGNQTAGPDDGSGGLGGNLTGNVTGTVTVTIQQDGGATAGNMTGGNATGGNATGGNESSEGGITVIWTVQAGGTIDETAIVWSNQSVPDAQNVTDYGNQSEPQTDVEPGEFTASFQPEGAGTYYVRAYAIVGGNTTFSEEATFEGAGAAGTVHEVTITSAPIGELSSYDPDELTIKVGDSVVWINEDNEAHTATAEDGTFDTGEIAGGEQSEPIVFETAGEFDYEDSEAMLGMISGTIIVEDA
jgi:plastocyanin